MSTGNSTRAPFAVLALAALLLAGLWGRSAQAETLTWTGSAGATWNATSGNWSGGGASPWDSSNGPANVADFNAAGGTLANIVGGAYAGGVTFDAPAAISGDSLVLGGAATITVNATSGTIGATLGGAAGLAVDGAGNLVLTAAENYGGPTGIGGGTLQLGTGNSGEDASIDGTSAVSDNAVMVYNTFASPTVSYAIGGQGSVIKNGPGTLTFTNTNSYTGGTVVNAGTLVLDAGAFHFGIVNGTATVNAGATLVVMADGNVFPTYATDTIDVNGGTLSSLVSTANRDLADTECYIGTVNLNSSSGVSAQVTTSDGGGFRFGGRTNGVLASSGSIENQWAADLRLVNANSPPNTMTIQAAAGNTLLVAGTIDDYPGLSGSPVILSGPGTVIFAASNTYVGSTEINGGTLQLGTGTFGQDGSIDSTAAILDNATLAYDISTGTRTAAVAISGSGSLAELGAGTLVLGLPNTYSGGTIVSGGTLLVTDDQALQTGSGLTVGKAAIFAPLLSAGAAAPGAPALAVAAVPEPGTMALCALAAIVAGGLAARRRRDTRRLERRRGRAGRPCARIEC